MQSQRFFSGDNTEKFMLILKMSDEDAIACCHDVKSLADLKNVLKAGHAIIAQKNNSIRTLKDDMSRKLCVPRSILEHHNAELIVRYMAIGRSLDKFNIYSDVDEDVLLKQLNTEKNERDKIYHTCSLIEQVYRIRKDEQCCLKRICCLI